MHYAYFDGDNVGSAIGSLLLKERTDEATHLSEKIKFAIYQITEQAKETQNLQVLIAGGDDLLVSYDPLLLDQIIFKKFVSIFQNITGLSMSYGIGESIDEALTMLSEAKKANTTPEPENHLQKSKSREIPLNSCLWIFVTSNNPDPYINAIAHCRAHHEISKVVLVGIVTDVGKKEAARDSLNEIEEHIGAQLEKLSQGQCYWFNRRDKEWQVKSINVEPADRRRYLDLLAVKRDVRLVTYQDLGENLQGFTQTMPDFNHLFDVTAVLKSQLVDIFVLLRFMGISSVYSFELINKPNHDDRDLIHNLTFRDDYRYPCLAGSVHTEDKTITGKRALVDSCRINDLISHLNRSESSNEKIVEHCSQEFAKRWMTAYFVVGMIGIGLLVKKVVDDGWDVVEPFLWIIAPTWVLLHYLLQAFVSRELPSLKPWELRKQLANWYRNRLMKIEKAHH